MRPDRMQNLLADSLNQDRRMAAQAYADAGFTRSLYGVIATTPGGTPVNVQIVGRLAPGERDDSPAAPVLGDAHPPLDAIDPVQGGKLDLAAFERFLADRAVRAAAEEVDSVALFQDRAQPGAVTYGATLNYRNGAAIWLYVFSAGQARHTDFEPPALVNA